MTKENIIELLKINKGYIKGYGSTLCRLMDFKHSPIVNVKKSIVKKLIEEGLIIKENLIYKLDNVLNEDIPPTTKYFKK